MKALVLSFPSKVILNKVPSSSADVARAMRGQPKRL